MSDTGQRSFKSYIVGWGLALAALTGILIWKIVS
jgi:hypothetical protein